MRTTTRPAPSLATRKQVQYIIDLANEHPQAKTYVDTQLHANRVNHPDQLSRSEASNVIGVLLLDKRNRADLTRTAKSESKGPDVGMYEAGGVVYRVYLGQQSGINLVKKVIATGETWIDREGNEQRVYTYEYIGAATQHLPSDAVPMDLERAKAWGKMTSSCCVCARRLDDPESVDAGIGPKCAKRVAS